MLTPADAHLGAIAFIFLTLNKCSPNVAHMNGLKVATESKFTNLKPHTAFLFPGQGAQMVGMAKVRSLAFTSPPICTALKCKSPVSLYSHPMCYAD